MRILAYESVDSTSERAFAALADGTARDGDVHVAQRQTAGRGRRGRTWESAPGEGLYLSRIHLPGPAPPPLPGAVGLTLAAGLAVHDAVGSVGLAGARLDWPNDVVVGRAKLAGTLVESRGLDPGRPHFVIGIGVNVLQRSFPAALEAERAVTSLAREGVETTPELLRAFLLGALESRLEAARADLAGLHRDYLAATGLHEAEVVVAVSERRHTGRLVDLDPEQGLLLRTGDRLLRLDPAHVRAVDPAPASL